MKKLFLALMLCAPMTMFAQKFGHIDSQAFMQSLPEVTTIQDQLQKKGKEYEQQITDMQNELQRKADEYDKTKSTMNATKQAETEKSLSDMQDTFFVEQSKLGDVTKNILLRSHTSSVQARVMETTQPPIRIICPGRVYRNEAITARAHCFFHQVEGLYIDKNVSFTDLKQVLLSFAREMFGAKVVPALPHEHKAGEMQHDKTQHWNACAKAECAEKLNTKGHTYTDWTWVTEPTDSSG